MKDVCHMDLKPQLSFSANRFRQAPPPPPSTTAALSSSHSLASSKDHSSHGLSSSRGLSSSKGRFDIFKLFKWLVSMCQRTNRRLDVIEQKLDANAYNHKLIHPKLQTEEPLREVLAAGDLSEPMDPFAFLTPDELNYSKMGESHLSGGPHGSDDNGSDGDYAHDDDDEATK
jgi:hypothetical protein